MLSAALLKCCRLQETDFTRNRSLSFVNLTVFIINFVKKSLQIELYNFADFFDIRSVTKQAFSKARKKLSPMVFVLLNQKLIEEFYTDNTIQTFKGLRLLAIDGSTLRLPNYPELSEQYGTNPANSKLPLAKISIMYDILNHVSLHGTIDCYHASERDLAIEHINELPQKNDVHQSFEDLLIFDRGYPSTGLLFLLHDLKRHFLMRIQDSFLAETNAVIKSGAHDLVITIAAFSKTKKLNLRLKEYLPNLPYNATMQFRVLVFDLGNGQK